MGNSYVPQAQLYSTGSDMKNNGAWSNSNMGAGGASNTALNFASPDGGHQGPSTSAGQNGKYWAGGNPVPNQVPTGTQGPTTPNYDPTLGMNAVYAQMNQTPGSIVSGPSPDVSMTPTPPTQIDGQPMASQIGPMSLYNLGQYSTPWAAASSPMGMSPYWSSPFLNSAAGGKGVM